MNSWSQRLVVGLAGPRVEPRTRSWLEEFPPAGVILFSRNVVDFVQLAGLCEDLHAVVPGLEISVDHEGGPVSHLAAALGRPPAPWSLGELDDISLTRRVHRETAQRMASAGVDRVLGPVADVMTESANPVIGSRAFGADAALVSRHVAEAVAGLREGGVKVCLKHWPGHGPSRTDTHLQAAVQGAGNDRTQETPFLAGLAAGADAVMVGHLPVAGSALPATLNRDFLAETRSRLTVGAGVPLLYADDVTMGALRDPMAGLGVPVPAGCDAGLLDPGELPASWLEAVAVAGCERILLRGIPWRALPPTNRARLPKRDMTVNAGPLPPADGYRVVRQRMWQRVPEDFLDHRKNLLWVDLARNDRWAEIGAQSGQEFLEMEACLEGLFGAVHRWPQPSAGQRWERMLVTSFRPWFLEPDKVGQLRNMFTDKGLAVVMGHPQLTAMLRKILPPAWGITALFEARTEALPCPEQGN